MNRILHVIIVFLVITSGIFAQTGKIMFTSRLNGAQEVPAVTTNGSGFISILFDENLTKMYVQGVASGLSGAITAAHFHTGAFGQNGAVLVNLATVRNGNKFAGEIAVPAGFIQKALIEGLYANIHTAQNPGGEIRGQVVLEGDLHIAGVLTALNEVPPVFSLGVSLGGLTIVSGSDKIVYNFKIAGLSGPITAAHIHKGVEGQNGAVVVPLTVSGKNLMGELSLSALPTDFFTTLFSEGYYVNVHTAANPGGEIRGQLFVGPGMTGSAILEGNQEVPAVNTMASGFGFAGFNETFDSLVYGVIVQDLSGPPTAAHVHTGAAGISGGVVFPLTAALAGVVYTGFVPVTAATINDFINNKLYFNVHTAANPGGEIRGQIINNLRKSYAFDLCASQENPKNSSLGYGAATISVDQNNQAAVYNVMTDAMSGPATAAHIHTGIAGVNGGVKFPIILPNPYSRGSIAVTAADVALMESSGMYFNVHTSANPGGEIRGQIGRKLSCPAISSIFEQKISELKIYPNPASDGVNITFDASQSIKGVLHVTDITGRILVTQPIQADENSNTKWYIPMQDLSPGMYYVRLRSQNQDWFVQPIVKH